MARAKKEKDASPPVAKKDAKLDAAVKKTAGASKVKKEESFPKQESKPKKQENGTVVVEEKIETKEEVEVEVKDDKVKTKAEKTVKRTRVVKEKEKKTYDLPGQKHDVPEERDPLRIFYETLREQIPTSEMAETWLMEHGLLPEDEARAAFEKKQKQKGKSGTPVKPSPSKATESSKSKAAKANGSSSKPTAKSKPKRERDASDEDDDDDFVAKPVSRKKLKT